MSDYDLLYGLVLRLEYSRGIDLDKDIDKLSERVGEIIQKEFPDFILVPFGFELVEDDKKVRILNNLKWDDRFETEEILGDDVND